MKGITVASAAAPFVLTDDIAQPKPGPHQILVKSLVTAVNPVEPYMQQTGLLVLSFPIVLGCDASGTIVEVGPEVTKFKVGDAVFGCTRLGSEGFGTFQDFFLMDEDIAFKKPENITTEEAATMGVGLLTAALGLGGMDINLMDNHKVEGTEWIIILGASGSVGQFAVQLAKIKGYKVLASCSPGNDEFVKGLGANETLNHRLALPEQLEKISSITNKTCTKVLDTSAMAAEAALAILASSSASGKKFFATTNDWSPIEGPEDVEICKIKLGDIGREGTEQATEVNNEIKSLIPVLEKWIVGGEVKPMTYEVVGSVGMESVLEALEVFGARKSGEKKVLIRIAEK